MALLYLAVLGIFGWLMISRRLTATLALPLAALCIAILALIPDALRCGVMPALNVLLNGVIEPGLTRLSNAIFAVILGAILAAQMKISGAAERLVRYAAEYAGEDRFRLGLLLLLVIALLFTTLGGLGAVILVASITLPLLFSLGFEPKAAGALFLLGLSLGGCLNPVNWALYKDVLELGPEQIVPYAVVLAIVFFLVCCAFLFVYTFERQRILAQLAPLLTLLANALVVGYVVLNYPDAWEWIKRGLAWLMAIALGLLMLLSLARLVAQLLTARRSHGAGWLAGPDNWLAGAAPLVPLLLLLWSSLNASLSASGAPPIKVEILSAMLAGIVFCALASFCRDGAGANRTMRALHEALTGAGPAVALMLGIGLLLVAINVDTTALHAGLLEGAVLKPVVDSFTPLVAHLPIASPLAFVLTFFVLSPLALYRGPLNLWGMGSGVIAILVGSAILAPALIMVAFFSVGMLQGVCDPTNTHNVWIANFCKLPVGELTRVTLPWVLAVVLIGLAAGALLFRGFF